MLTLTQSKLEGCLNIQPTVFDDERGRFVKVFNKDFFLAHGLETEYLEDYYSTSVKGVIRGLHFQTPPLDHVKLVFCVKGQVVDVVLDLRVGSPTYGAVDVFELSAEKANFIYIPKGFAHGFCVLSDEATMVYKVSSPYSIKHDSGVLWSSIDFNWPVKDPVLSARDKSFESLENFASPFIFI